LGEAAGFAATARFAGVVRFATEARFGEAACFADLPGFEEPLKTSDSQPASLASIGRSSIAAIAAMMVRRRGQTTRPERADFPPDDGNCCFPPAWFSFAPHDSMAKTPFDRHYNHRLPKIYCALDLDWGQKSSMSDWRRRFNPSTAP
jgi:hypothetical protein